MSGQGNAVPSGNSQPPASDPNLGLATQTSLVHQDYIPGPEEQAALDLFALADSDGRS